MFILSRSESWKLCVLRCLYQSFQSCWVQVAVSVKILFHYSLAIQLELHFFAACLLVSVIIIMRVDAVFLRLVVKIALLVSISIFMSSQRYSRIFIKAADHAFLSVSFILYLFPQQLLMGITLLNNIYQIAKWFGVKDKLRFD